MALEIMTGRMRVVCAGAEGVPCGADLGTRPCLPEQTGRVSHGLCEACAQVYREQMAAWLPEKNLGDGAGEESATAAGSPSCANQQCPVGRPPASSIMSTHTTPTPVLTGLFARQVAKVTGLTERQLENLHGRDWGAPGHFTFVPGVHGGMFYAPKGLDGLIEHLRLAGYAHEAQLLAAADRVELCSKKTPAPAPAPAEPVIGRRWDLEHERRMDELDMCPSEGGGE